MLDIFISTVLAILTMVMAYLGVHVTLHPPNESPRAQLGYKVGFVVCGLLAVALVITQGVRTERSKQRSSQEISDLKGTLASVRGDLSSVEIATALIRSEQTTEIARRQQAETDLALIIRGSGKAVREGVVADIKKSPISVQINGQLSSPQPLEVQNIKLFSEAESSTHADAVYAVKVCEALLKAHFINFRLNCLRRRQAMLKSIFGCRDHREPPGEESNKVLRNPTALGKLRSRRKTAISQIDRRSKRVIACGC